VFTVIDRLGKVISLTYNWYSGRHKKSVKGQNIIVITINVGDRIIPINIRPIGKSVGNRANTSKPQVFRSMIVEIVEFFKQNGIDLTQFPITVDSWYGSDKLVFKKEGFDVILVHAKSNYVFTIDGIKKKLSAHKKDIEFDESAWGCKGIPVARKTAESPTFGKVILLFFRDGNNIKCVMAFGRKLRACEILSIWRQHHCVEQFFRRLKTVHKMRMRCREGVYATIGINCLHIC